MCTAQVVELYCLGKSKNHNFYPHKNSCGIMSVVIIWPTEEAWLDVSEETGGWVLSRSSLRLLRDHHLHFWHPNGDPSLATIHSPTNNLLSHFIIYLSLYILHNTSAPSLSTHLQIFPLFLSSLPQSNSCVCYFLQTAQPLIAAMDPNQYTMYHLYRSDTNYTNAHHIKVRFIHHYTYLQV